MLSEREQLQIRLISDNELYQQAVALMKNLGGTLSQSQINGLVNVSLANTYNHLKQFVQHQGERKTWSARERHIWEFYRTKFPRQLNLLENYVPAVTRLRQEQVSQEDEEAIKMALAREFIQHLLAENMYQDALRRASWAPNQQHQERPHGRGDQRR